MTESTPENPSSGGTTISTDNTTPDKANTDKTTTAKPSHRSPRETARRKGKGVVAALIIAILLIVALAAALWYQQENFRKDRDALAGQVQQGNVASRAAQDQAREALQLAQSQSRQLAQLQSSVEQSQSQVHSLQQALQMLTDTGSNLAILNDIDHLVTIAHQQLLLSGNVANAIVALETAQAQLARTNRPALAPLQQAINGDLDRLRAVSTVDVNVLSSRLEELSRLVSRAPLLVPDAAVPEVPQSSNAPLGSTQNDSSLPPAASQPGATAQTIHTAASADEASGSWWQRGLGSARSWTSDALDALRQELSDFIRVRRVDDSSALLLSAEQGAQLRDSLRLRIMTAQLALLMHQPDIWNTELRNVVQVLETRYDTQSQDTRRALELARKMAETPIDVKLPTVRNSQDTLQALREDNARLLEPQSAESHDESAEAGDPSADEAAQDEAPATDDLPASDTSQTQE